MSPEMAMTDEDEATADREEDQRHLAELEDGAGCTEIWEYLSNRRDDDAD